VILSPGMKTLEHGWVAEERRLRTGAGQVSSAR
jgi:hypothetical protein